LFLRKMGKRVCDLVISQSGTDSVSVAGSTRKRKVSVEDARKTLDEKRSRHSRSVSLVDEAESSTNPPPLTEKELEAIGHRLREARKSVGRIRTCLSRDRTHLYNSKEEERKLRVQITSARSNTKKYRESYERLKREKEKLAEERARVQKELQRERNKYEAELRALDEDKNALAMIKDKMRKLEEQKNRQQDIKSAREREEREKLERERRQLEEEKRRYAQERDRLERERQQYKKSDVASRTSSSSSSYRVSSSHATSRTGSAEYRRGDESSSFAARDRRDTSTRDTSERNRPPIYDARTQHSTPSDSRKDYDRYSSSTSARYSSYGQSSYRSNNGYNTGSR